MASQAVISKISLIFVWVDFVLAFKHQGSGDRLLQVMYETNFRDTYICFYFFPDFFGQLRVCA